MELNKIQTSGSWGKAADDLNQNFSKVNNAVEQVKNATTRNKGYFSTDTALKSAFKSASLGDIAYVQNSNLLPFERWEWDGTQWIATGVAGGDQKVELGDYYTKDVTDAKLSELGQEVGPISKFYRIGYIDTETKLWVINNTQSKYVILPVSEGDKVVLRTNLVKETAVAYLTDYTQPSDGETASLNPLIPDVQFYQTGYTYTPIIGTDTKFLYISLDKDFSRLPLSLTINGYEVLDTIRENIEKTLLSISDAHEKIKSLGLVQLSEYKIHKRIADGVLIDDALNECAIIPIDSGVRIRIKSNSVRAASYAILSAVDGSSITYSSDAVYSGVKTLNIDRIIDFTTPVDSQYLYIYCGNQDGFTPTSVLMNGYEIISVPVNSIEEIDLRIDKALNGLGLIYQASKYTTLYGAYIDATTKTWREAVNGKFLLIPIKGGDSIDIRTLSEKYYPIAFLRTKSYPSINNAVDLSSVEGFDSPYQIHQSIPYLTTAPSDSNYLYVYTDFFNSTLPIAIYVNGYNVLASVAENINSAGKSSPMNIRLMQYNIGRYNYGDNSGYMSEELYQSKLQSYRRFLCRYHPNILGMEEYLQYMVNNDTHDADEVLFGQLFKQSRVYVEGCIKSNYDIIYGLTGRVDSDTYPSIRANFVENRFKVADRIIGVVVTALSSDETEEAMIGRKECLKKIIDLIDDCEYGFVLLDMNNVGLGTTETSFEEGVSINNYMKTLGWECCNNGYLGSIITNEYWAYSADNIIYKNNGKTILRDFNVLEEEFENLSSDHYPVYADFELL